MERYIAKSSQLSLVYMLVILVTLLTSNLVRASTLDAVKQRGMLLCGVSQSLPGFSYPQDDGSWTGLDVDICRAIASAIFHNPKKVKFTPLSAKERFTALQSGEIDVLSRNTTWTLVRDVSLGIDFTNITFYDGQGFMVPKALGVTSVMDLSGATICTNTGTTTELNLADYFRAHNLEYNIVTFEKADEVVAAYNAGRCDVYTTDKSGLAAQRIKLTSPTDHMILPEIISKEPLGVAVRQNDHLWKDIVRWIVYGLITAEEYDVTQQNVKKQKKSNIPAVQRLLGTKGKLGAALHLSPKFMFHVIKHVGNYGEIFERNIGEQSILKLPRGDNALWSRGGLMYAPPFR